MITENQSIPHLSNKIIYKFYNSYVYKLRTKFKYLLYNLQNVAGWQSGHAAACKAVYAGSIPASASINLKALYYTKYNINLVSINLPEWWNW